MIGLHMSDEIERQEFAKKAARDFASNPKRSTFTVGDVVPGCWFAVRWGLGDDCVLVFKVDEYGPVINYYELVRAYNDVRSAA